MREVAVLASREFRVFLRSPLGYVILAVHALAAGLIFVTLLFLYREQLLQAIQPGAGGLPGSMGVSVQLIVASPYLLNVASLLLFVLPFVTMRTFAEERRGRSLELLISYPLRAWQIVLGKYLGVALFGLLLLAITLLHLIILRLVTDAALLPLLGGVLGLGLFMMALLAIGLFVSTLTVGQVEAAVLTLGLFMVLAMVGGVSRPESSLQVALANLSPLYQFIGFGNGQLTPSGVLFFLAVSVLGVGLTVRGVDLIKWRG